MLLCPRYGSGSLADVVPSVLSHLGVAGATDRIGMDLAHVRHVCLLVVDGLGAEQLASHSAFAPFLNSHTHTQKPISASFPTTTATSLSSIGSGLPPGEHGIVGYLVAPPGHKALMNLLQWKLHDSAATDALPDDLVPETFQPSPTAFERARASGVDVFHIGPSFQRGSGLTRASLRGATFRSAVTTGDLAARACETFDTPSPTLAYTYYGDLDLVGHVRGPQSEAWRSELQQVDTLARTLAERLPSDGALVVVADHGMVEVDRRIDYDTTPHLREDVRLLGGEPRMRYIYARDGAIADVCARWEGHLGESFTVVTKEDAIDRGWFGPTVSAAAYARIGDALVLANDRSAIIRSAAESSASTLLGHHGSLTSAEVMVPGLVIRPHH